MKGVRPGTNSLGVSTVKKILDLSNNGLNRKQIATELSISKMSVYNYQKKYGLI